jgi:hypothetical protein
MTEIDIERCREQAKALGYGNVYNKDNIFYYFAGDNWEIYLTVELHSFPDAYIVQAKLFGTNTEIIREFATGYKDILGPAHQWCKSFIAFNKFIEG